MITSIAPVQAPITGREDINELRDPVQALAQFYRAFNQRDLLLMERNWDNSPEVAMDNPVGGIKRGWPEIRAVYERIFNSGTAVTVEFYDYTVHTFTDMFYAVGRERGHATKGGSSVELRIRTTRLFRRVKDGTWKQIHHHGSFDDPTLLAVYQESVK